MFWYIASFHSFYFRPAQSFYFPFCCWFKSGLLENPLCGLFDSVLPSWSGASFASYTLMMLIFTLSKKMFKGVFTSYLHYVKANQQPHFSFLKTHFTALDQIRRKRNELKWTLDADVEGWLAGRRWDFLSLDISEFSNEKMNNFSILWRTETFQSIDVH